MSFIGWGSVIKMGLPACPTLSRTYMHVRKWLVLIPSSSVPKSACFYMLFRNTNVRVYKKTKRAFDLKHLVFRQTESSVLESSVLVCWFLPLLGKSCVTSCRMIAFLSFLTDF